METIILLAFFLSVNLASETNLLELEGVLGFYCGCHGRESASKISTFLFCRQQKYQELSDQNNVQNRDDRGEPCFSAYVAL